MGKHVTFDYSLADKFIREDEVELMMASVRAIGVKKRGRK